MELSSKQTIKHLLAEHNIHPEKGLGQNFLVDRNTIEKLAAAADLQPSDVVIEIGPGIGTLTRVLASRAKKVVAIEKDRNMVAILKETLQDLSNVELVQGDALKVDYTKYLPRRQASDIQDTRYKIVASLPFYIASPVIRRFLESVKQKPQHMTFVIQKEVAQRICARPPKMNILAVSVQFYAVPKVITYVKKTSFWPQPKVDSAIINITPHDENLKVDSQRFFKVMKAGFKQPRKQLVNNLSKELKLSRKKVEQWLRKNDIHPTQRAETLGAQDWINLAKSLQ